MDTNDGEPDCAATDVIWAGPDVGVVTGDVLIAVLVVEDDEPKVICVDSKPPNSPPSVVELVVPVAVLVEGFGAAEVLPVGVAAAPELVLAVPLGPSGVPVPVAVLALVLGLGVVACPARTGYSTNGCAFAL